MSTSRVSGVLAPVVTPFGADLRPDAARLARLCRWLLSQNCGLAVFGTNSEANSMSLDERLDLLDGLVEAGIDAARMMPGTGCCAVTDTVRLSKRAAELGCAGTLMLPPFYYKGVSDDGLFRSYCEVIERVGDARLKVYLYHIPPVAQVPITLGLIERLVKAYPDTVVGMKDSSGDWSNTQAVLDAFPDFDMFVGSEKFLLANMRNGGAGCISAIANVNPGGIDALYRGWQAGNADTVQSELDRVREVMMRYPMIPALKAVVARAMGEEGWCRVRPPLVDLDAGQRARLIEELGGIGFTMEIAAAA
jgi:4-hydroxy-tetrahydrodipicolinate synthase